MQSTDLTKVSLRTRPGESLVHWFTAELTTNSLTGEERHILCVLFEQFRLRAALRGGLNSLQSWHLGYPTGHSAELPSSRDIDRPASNNAPRSKASRSLVIKEKPIRPIDAIAWSR